MLARNDVAEYLLDNYGACDRGADCYWGKDTRGAFNGCLKTGWRGRACRHWQPSGITSLEEMRERLESYYVTREAE